MNVVISPTFSQVFNFEEGTEGCGCCGFFIFRPGELILDEEEKKLVRVWRASQLQRERVTQWLMELGEQRLRLEEMPEGTDPQLELRARAGSLLKPETRITEEGLARFAQVVQEAVLSLKDGRVESEEEMN